MESTEHSTATTGRQTALHLFIAVVAGLVLLSGAAYAYDPVVGGGTSPGGSGGTSPGGGTPPGGGGGPAPSPGASAPCRYLPMGPDGGAGAGEGGSGDSGGGGPLDAGITAPSGGPSSPGGGAPGSTGVPLIGDLGVGVSEIVAAGPAVHASVNGTGGGGSVYLGNGGSYIATRDFRLTLNGIDWLHDRIYSSEGSSIPSQWQGEGWWANEMINITGLANDEDDNDCSVQMSPNHTLEFDNTGTGTWDCEDNFLFTLTYSSHDDEFILTRPEGFTWVFHDLNVASVPGRLKRIEDAYGNDRTFTYSGSQLDYIVIDVVEGNDHKITYDYFSSGDNDGLLQYVKVYKSTTTTDANLIGQIEYAYHDATVDDYGSEDDLLKVTISAKATNDGDGTLSISREYFYRYYKGTYNAITNPGTDHALRYVLLPENADRLNTAEGDPLTQTNTVFEDYANVIYAYDSNGLVRQTDERRPGAGCGCGGAGGTTATTTYTWAVNGSSPDLDTWYIHCVADRADDTRVIYDANTVGQILTWVVQDTDDGSPNRELIWHYDYGTSGATENRMTGIHYPSNCTAYSETAPYGVTLSSSAGVVYTLDYDFATSTYDGYLEKVQIQEGTSGTANTLVAYGRTISERPDLVTSMINYESTGEQDGRTTTYTYAFYDSGGNKVQPKQLTVTHPSVSAAKNGPGASAVEYQYYDERTGALRWAKDGEGYVWFMAYDTATGVRDLTVVDANTTTLMQVIDGNWDGAAHGGLTNDDDVPADLARSGSGTALDIDSTAEIDWLARTRKTTASEGLITYYVYKDDETRVYPAWNTTNSDCDLPIRVTLTDKNGQAEEILTLSTDLSPNTSNSEPIGTESYSNSDLTTWTVTTYNIAGALEHTDRYHDIPASGNGTQYTNYYRSSRVYDDMGRLAYQATAVADETTYDREQVVGYEYDFAGRQIKLTQGVSDNTHDLDLTDVASNGLPTMNTMTEYFYDSPSGSVTQGEGDGQLRYVRRWYGTSTGEYNDTEMRYDERNRRCLTIPPLPPYTLVKYDNLGRITASGTYSATTSLDPGDDPASTAYSIRVGLAKTHFDETGRVYKTEKYDDPGDATPADALATNRYYDRRGRTWAVDAPNTGISFTEYDGAGRRIATFSGTQFDASKYTGSAPDYPDDNEGIVQHTAYTLDEAGNVTKVITKELNHNDSGGDGMDLDGSDFIRTYKYSWYDDTHRMTDTANYGTFSTNGWSDESTAPTYGASAPSRSDTVLVTSYSYDKNGRQDKVTGPRGIETATDYDDLGRTIAKTEDATTNGLNRKTEYQYDAQGSLVRIVHDPDANNTFSGGVWTMVGGDSDQVTEYAYTDSTDASRVSEIRYPTGDGTVGSSAQDRIVFTYDIDGTVATRTDQNGTVLTWIYDAKRRKTEEEVTSVGSYTGGGGSVDSTVRAVTWTYTDEGKVEYLTTHTDPTPDTTTFTDANSQIKHHYDSGGYLTQVEMDHDSKVGDNTGISGYSTGLSYDADFTTNGNHKRLQYVEYPDGRKIWRGYTHKATAKFQDDINNAFSRVGQLAFDDNGSIGDVFAQYDFNGRGRFIRRKHLADAGWAGNSTRKTYETAGVYSGLDSFGRIVDLQHQVMYASWYDDERRKYTYDRSGNRTSIENTLEKAQSQVFTYDDLNRLTQADTGILVNDEIAESNVQRVYDMDLLGNMGGLDLNGVTDVAAHSTNATNEISSIAQANPAGAAALVDDDFATSISGLWTQDTGTWSISSGKLNVSTLSSGEAILLADAELDMVNYGLEITFPTDSATSKAGLVFCHNGDGDYYAVVLDRSAGKIALHQITSGSWGAALDSANATINQETAYTIRVNRKQATLTAWVEGQSSATFTYDLQADFGVGYSGFYSDKASVTFDDAEFLDATARDALLPRFSGLADASVSSGALSVSASTRGGEAVVENFHDDDYMVQVTADTSSEDAELWFRYTDANNGYKLLLAASGGLQLYSYKADKLPRLWTPEQYTADSSVAVKIKVSGTSLKVWVDGTLKFSKTDSDHAAGTVAFGKGTWDGLKMGYDKNTDDDIDDLVDAVVIDEDFSSNVQSFSYDDAGNLVQDGEFTYTYDAWHRLVKAVAREGSDVTVGEYQYDGKGRRIKKVVTNSGDLDGTELYYYGKGHQVIETRDGSENVVQQVYHGTQYIDEIVAMKLEHGLAFVHQDANWNVIALTDAYGWTLERYRYTPYGVMTVDQQTHQGDCDNDGKVTLLEWDTTGDGKVDGDDTCVGPAPAGACRLLDFDFDGDVDSDDTTVLASLDTGETYRRPGQTVSGVGNTRGHQGLIYDAELSSYHNRARQFDPRAKRFLQRDPLAFRETRFSARTNYRDGLGLYNYVKASPLGHVDPRGLCTQADIDALIMGDADVSYLWGLTPPCCSIKPACNIFCWGTGHTTCTPAVIGGSGITRADVCIRTSRFGPAIKVTLLHELWHALTCCSGRWPGACTPEGALDEIYAIVVEASTCSGVGEAGCKQCISAQCQESIGPCDDVTGGEAALCDMAYDAAEASLGGGFCSY